MLERIAKYCARQANIHATKGRFSLAIALFTLAIHGSKNPALILAQRALLKENYGDEEGAKRDIQRAKHLDPSLADLEEDPSIRKLKKLIQSMDGLIERGESGLKVLAAPNKQLAQMAFDRAERRVVEKDFAGAIKSYTAALRHSPDDPRIFHARGMGFLDINDYPKAIADFTAAIEIGDKSHRSFFGRGHARFNAGDVEGAISDFERVLQSDPENLTALMNLGIASNAPSQNPNPAVHVFDRVLELAPMMSDALLQRGFAKMEHDRKGARLDFETVLKTDKKNPRALFGLGLLDRSSKKSKNRPSPMRQAANLGYEPAIDFLRNRHLKTELPQPNSEASTKPDDLTDEDLAVVYVDAIFKLRKKKPTQDDLGRLAGFSQPSWSRREGSSLWKAVAKEIGTRQELLIHALTQVDDQIKRLSDFNNRHKRKKEPEIDGSDETTHKTALEHADPSDDLDRLVDRETVEKMGRNELIHEILLHHPQIKRGELENRSTEDLRSFLI